MEVAVQRDICDYLASRVPIQPHQHRASGNAIDPLLPAILQVSLLAILGGLATHFPVNPSQTYNPPQS
jgi:hypothetical protein